MQEQSKFNMRPQTGADKLNQQAVEGSVKLTPEELLEQENAERDMVMGVLSGEGQQYMACPYYAQDNSLRVRVKNARGDIIYDDALDQFVDLARKMSVNISPGEINRLTAEAKANAVEH